MNCLIGIGDSGKTTILDAIDLCLGARRSHSFSDYDFHGTDSSQPITIRVAITNLEDQLQNVDAYGEYLSGYDSAQRKIEPEPSPDAHPALILQLKVEKDLEPQWSIVSKRAVERGIERNLKWEDRQLVAPLRLGEHTDWHLSWRRGALFERLTEEALALTEGLSDAARKARTDFGSSANAELVQTLEKVEESAQALGVPTAGSVQALLDANAVKFGTGAISLHDAGNVPLSSLGKGSKRLLVAGLAKEVTQAASISLVDEIETGLEPHRIRGLLNTLGVKDEDSAKQVFATTHSPVVLRELRHTQLSVIRQDATTSRHIAIDAGVSAQGILRSYPEAFLGRRVIVCEGISEVGFIRGRDQHLSNTGLSSIEALGTVLVSAGGDSKVLTPANEFIRLGYPVAIFMDSDKPLTEDDENSFLASGGKMFRWPENWALEEAIFRSSTNATIGLLLDYASSLSRNERIDDHIKSASGGRYGYNDVRAWAQSGEVRPDIKQVLGLAAKRSEWFKQIEPYEYVVRGILSPNWLAMDQRLVVLTNNLMNWAQGVA